MSSKKLSVALACVAMLAAMPSNAATKKSRNKSVAQINPDTVEYTPSANTIGFEFGPGVANTSYSAPGDQATTPLSTRTRVMLGAYYERAIIPYFSIRPELNYVQRGFSVTEQGGTADAAANYLEVPVFAKAQLPLGVVTPYVLTGPFIGLLVGSGLAITPTNGQEQDSNLNLNSFNFGWAFGGGSSFAITRQLSLEASLRYSMGLINVDPTAAAGASTKLNAVQIMAGVGYTL